MLSKLDELLRRWRTKIHSFTLGTTLALGAILASQVGQTCTLGGQ
jgi:hypothetical protein